MITSHNRWKRTFFIYFVVGEAGTKAKSKVLRRVVRQARRTSAPPSKGVSKTVYIFAGMGIGIAISVAAVLLIFCIEKYRSKHSDLVLDLQLFHFNFKLFKCFMRHTILINLIFSLRYEVTLLMNKWTFASMICKAKSCAIIVKITNSKL